MQETSEQTTTASSTTESPPESTGVANLQYRERVSLFSVNPDVSSEDTKMVWLGWVDVYDTLYVISGNECLISTGSQILRNSNIEGEDNRRSMGEFDAIMSESSRHSVGWSGIEAEKAILWLAQHGWWELIPENFHAYFHVDCGHDYEGTFYKNVFEEIDKSWGAAEFYKAIDDILSIE